MVSDSLLIPLRLRSLRLQESTRSPMLLARFSKLPTVLCRRSFCVRRWGGHKLLKRFDMTQFEVDHNHCCIKRACLKIIVRQSRFQVIVAARAARYLVQVTCQLQGQRQVVMDTVPPSLKFLLGQLCQLSVSRSDVLISRPSLEMLALGVLQRVEECNTVRIQKKIADTLDDSLALHFESTEPGPAGSVQYSVDMVPILLGECGMDFSVDAWANTVSELVNKLSACALSESQVDVDLGSSSGSDFEEFMLNALHDHDSSSTRSATSASFVSDTSVSEPSESEAWFEKLSRDELLAKLHARDSEILRLQQSLDREETLHGVAKASLKRLRAELKQSKRHCTGLMTKAASSAEREKQLQSEIEKYKSMIIERRGKYLKDVEDELVGERGWLTPAGIVQLGIKRNLAHCASEHLQLLIQQDVSRWTVSRRLAHMSFLSSVLVESVVERWGGGTCSVCILECAACL